MYSKGHLLVPFYSLQHSHIHWRETYQSLEERREFPFRNLIVSNTSPINPVEEDILVQKILDKMVICEEDQALHRWGSSGRKQINLRIFKQLFTWKSIPLISRASDALIVPPALSPATPIFAVSSTPKHILHCPSDTVKLNFEPKDVLFSMIYCVTAAESSSQIGYLCSGPSGYSTEIQIIFVDLFSSNTWEEANELWFYSAR